VQRFELTDGEEEEWNQDEDFGMQGELEKGNREDCA
jgi:hypothetical protein